MSRTFLLVMIEPLLVAESLDGKYKNSHQRNGEINTRNHVWVRKIAMYKTKENYDEKKKKLWTKI